MTKLLLIGIFIFGLLLRILNINSFPPLNADEAALGYNALSLAETGKDEHGSSWPIHLQSFNDYKPALYTYLLILPIKLFGLNEFTVRFPGVIVSTLTIYGVYLLTKRLLQDHPQKIQISLISSLFLAISPWHIHFSRGAWEVSLATFFVVFGLYFYLIAISEKKLGYYLLSSSLFVISLYAYHAARIVVPLLVFGIAIIYFRDNLKNWKKVVVSVGLGFVLISPLAVDFLKGAVMSRAAGVGLFADSGPLSRINEQRGEHTDYTGMTAKILHNKPVNYALSFLENWGEHYSGEFLFVSGDDIQRNKVPEHGQMYLHDAFFVIIGLLLILGSLSRGKKTLLYWLLISPVAAALTFQSPHALRSQNMVIPIVIVSAYGLVGIMNYTKSKLSVNHLDKLVHLLFLTIVSWGFLRYQYHYWIHMPREYPFSSQYGFEEMISYVSQESGKYDRIVITDRYDQPYILTLFYLNYPPEKFQSEHELTSPDGFGFSTVREFDKYKFISIGDWSEIQNNYKNSLIIGTSQEIPEASNIVKEIYFPNGDVAYRIVAN